MTDIEMRQWAASQLLAVGKPVTREAVDELVAMTLPPKVSPPPQPAVDPACSVFPDRIISLENGRPYQSLRRHLARLGMTPAQYREKWGLPSN